MLVDSRPGWQRATEGEVPDALLVERNHLEGWCDPECTARLPQASGYDTQVIVRCSEGYASSFAADSLRRLGLHRATDVMGGFRAWVVQRGGHCAAAVACRDDCPGTGDPDPQPEVRPSRPVAESLRRR